MESTLTEYIYEAIALEKAGKKPELKKPSEYPFPEELQSRLDRDAALRAAFAALSPGRKKSHIFHIATAKQEKTDQREWKGACR